MADRYSQLINTPIGKVISKQIGLPQPPPLERWEPGKPVISGPVLFGAAPGGRLARPVAQVLASIRAEIHTPMQEEIRSAVAAADTDAKVFNAEATPSEQRFKALVFDATGISSSEELRAAYEFFHPTIRRVRNSGRIVILATPPSSCRNPRQALAQRALEGLTRSLGKEVKRGATAQLVYVAPKAESLIESTLRFLLSPKSAYVSGQVVRIAPPKSPLDAGVVDWESPLEGKIALVTGASRGIGRAIAQTLARDGAHVVGLDIPSQADDLALVAAETGGSTLPMDITAADAPRQIVDHLEKQHGGVDVVVHNAGVTRDKTLGRMTEDQWDMVLEVNLGAEQRIDHELFERGVVNPNGRIICVSSISAIAGNAGQTNYATSKAGVIGMVEAYAPALSKSGQTVNAVAPGFIETQMTAAMPIGLREAGRRMNSMSQGGLPVDVAETIAWFASPGSAGVNGNVVRVCGQSLLGA
ncbi:MAG TPA: 3-oxoacyl-ACP reductase [Solirubrobacteraceae bacterium]|jgi:3-oxoacyl-[acyl-carrier protein] reductase|nr:3-oxoacyl-ACP reductase [Solirubrobacteraceae bacterium]